MGGRGKVVASGWICKKGFLWELHPGLFCLVGSFAQWLLAREN